MGGLLEREGDLFGSEAPALGHGVNVDGAMGAGVARAFRTRYPKMCREYVLACHRHDLAPGQTLPWRSQAGTWVYNMATQGAALAWTG